MVMLMDQERKGSNLRFFANDVFCNFENFRGCFVQNYLIIGPFSNFSIDFVLISISFILLFLSLKFRCQSPEHMFIITSSDEST